MSERETFPGESAFDARMPAGIRFREHLGSGWRSHWLGVCQVSLERIVAMKLLRPEFADQPEICKTFFEAGQKSAAITHPVAVPIINIFPDQKCLLCELPPGTPLDKQGGSLAPWQLAAMGKAIMDCLASLHATNRCHGCLTPANIFIGDGCDVRLQDFFQPPIVSFDGEIRAGWPDFVAPELFSIAGNAADGNWRQDAFSLGKCLRYAADPASLESETGTFAATISDPDPAKRGASPSGILNTFRELRRLEEARTGLTIRRSRRLYRRVPAEFEVSMSLRSVTPTEIGSLLALIHDISENGVFIEIKQGAAPGVGSILELNFSIKGTAESVHAFGVVRWLSSPPLPPGVGIQFVEVDRPALASLRKFIADRKISGKSLRDDSAGEPVGAQ
ncbi:MAG: PilZ domain-containing protein [Planctomycetota bacterium]|jgi:hypothetical protein|nr:PilZ domain-containing protein [Planctomycetota bacterium]